MGDVEVHAQAKGGAHAGGPFNKHTEQETQCEQEEVSLPLSEDHREGGEGVGLWCNELDAAFGELDGKENSDTGPNDGAWHHAHDVPFRNVIRAVSDVEAVLVIPDDRPGHGNGRTKHRRTDQPEQYGILR